MAEKVKYTAIQLPESLVEELRSGRWLILRPTAEPSRMQR